MATEKTSHRGEVLRFEMRQEPRFGDVTDLIEFRLLVRIRNPPISSVEIWSERQL